jgi:hypothetical protein
MTVNLHEELCSHLAACLLERNVLYTAGGESMGHVMPNTLSAGFIGSRDNETKREGALQNCYDLAPIPGLFCYRMWTREAEECKKG